VYAVPGSPLDPTATGCLDELAEGAQLLRLASDLPVSPDAAANDGAGAPRDDVASVVRGASAIVDVLTELGSLSLDELAERLGSAPRQVLVQLMRLELGGAIHRERSGRYALAAIETD